MYYGDFTEITPCRDAIKKLEFRVERKDDIIEILLPVDGDHPLLMTINLKENTFDAEGYD